jgi:hypothetical protein
MHKLKTRWWKEKGAKNCKAMRNAPKGASALKLDNVAGAFLVLVLGMGLSVITAFTEFFWGSRKHLATENVRVGNSATEHNLPFAVRQMQPYEERGSFKLWPSWSKDACTQEHLDALLLLLLLLLVL